MTKMIKLSLVAAVAVAGFTTTASAGNLEEMIKGTELSGSVNYTMEKTGSDTAEAQHDIDIRATLKSKVNDKITATLRFDEAQDDDNDDDSKTLTVDTTAGTTNTAVDSASSDNTNANSLELQIDRAYFTYKNAGITSNFGLIGAPLTDGAQADGINVSMKAGAMTVGGGYLYTTALGTQDVAYVTAAGKAGPAGFSVAYATVAESDQDTTAKSGANMLVDANMMAGPAKVGVKYASATGDRAGNNTGKDQTQTKIYASAKAGNLTIAAAYVKNGDDGGLVMIDESKESSTNISIGATNVSGKSNAILAGLSIVKLPGVDAVLSIDILISTCSPGRAE